jgi:hypothetical protein
VSVWRTTKQKSKEQTSNFVQQRLRVCGWRSRFVFGIFSIFLGIVFFLKAQTGVVVGTEPLGTAIEGGGGMLMFSFEECSFV